ncbi:MAG TPA: hypothetical protein VIG24_16310 [Acidimicrobiia bacterium]
MSEPTLEKARRHGIRIVTGETGFRMVTYYYRGYWFVSHVLRFA